MRRMIAAACAVLMVVIFAETATAAPPKPASCVAELQPDGTVKVSWTATSNPTVFHVREYGYSKKVNVSGTQRSMIWPHPIKDDPADWAIRARNSTGTSGACITAAIDVSVDPDPPEPPDPSTGDLPYSADSFYKSRVDGTGVPIDETLTAEMRAFMATYSEQASVPYPKINLNPSWSGHNYVHRSDDTAPVWRLASDAGGTSNSRLDIVRTQGVHIADHVWDTVPTGTQDRLLVLQDHVFGYTVQCADVVPNQAVRTWTASNCGIFWHTSNGLDYRNPLSNDSRNFSSRGRVIDAMQVPREELDRAIEQGTGVGHVMHLFWVRTHQPHGFSHPMVGTESETGGWGGEGWRIRLNPSIDLEARGLSGAVLALARTLQENGAYIGDNSGSATQLKVGPPSDYVGTNLTTNAFSGKITWDDFEVVQPGWPG